MFGNDNSKDSDVTPIDTPITDPSEIFREESYVAKARLLTSDYRDILLDIIDKESFSLQTKLALSNIIYSGFDKNVVLAKNKDIDIRKLEFEIALNLARLSYKKTDTLNPALSNIENTIKNHFNDFVSRSSEGWERGLQNKSEISTEQKINQNVTQNKSSEKKKGFNFNFLGGD
jgi:hypothetical protein